MLWHYVYDVFFLSCCSDPFSEFCRDLHSAVPTTFLWAAGVRSRVSSLPGFVRREASLTTCLRSPPSVQRQVQASRYIDSINIPHYSSTTWPAPTDGPAVHWLHHHGQPGHDGVRPERCQQCGHDVGRLLHHLGVGRYGRCHVMTHFCCGPALTDTDTSRVRTDKTATAAADTGSVADTKLLPESQGTLTKTWIISKWVYWFS